MVVRAQKSDVPGVCAGTEWDVTDRNTLVVALARLLVGRTDHALRVLVGENPDQPVARERLRSELRKRLTVPVGSDPWRRDGLLFELISWIVAKSGLSSPGAIVAPHLKSTFQGTDGIRIQIADGTDELSADIYENKCTTDAQRMFSQEVIPAFGKYLAGDYDDEIMQKVISLLERLGLANDKLTQVIDDFENARRYSLHACLTTEGKAPARSQIFARFPELQLAEASRNGHTFDTADVRKWFADLAIDVLAEIEKYV